LDQLLGVVPFRAIEVVHRIRRLGGGQILGHPFPQGRVENELELVSSDRNRRPPAEQRGVLRIDAEIALSIVHEPGDQMQRLVVGGALGQGGSVTHRREENQQRCARDDRAESEPGEAQG
jgi:hypothetical protein